MEPVSAISPNQTSVLTLQNTPAPPPLVRHEVVRTAPQPSSLPDLSANINRFPESTASSITQTFQEVEILALQAAEIGLDTETLEQIQALVEEYLSGLVKTLEDVSQENLQLLAAFFQNPSVSGLSNSNPSQDLTDAVFSAPQNLTENFPGSLLNIDVTSEPGILAVLTLAGTIIDLFSTQDTGSLLGSLPEIRSRNPSGFSDETETATADSGPSESELAFARFLASTQYPLPIRTGRDTPTIIDFV